MKKAKKRAKKRARLQRRVSPRPVRKAESVEPEPRVIKQDPPTGPGTPGTEPTPTDVPVMSEI